MPIYPQDLFYASQLNQVQIKENWVTHSRNLRQKIAAEFQFVTYGQINFFR